jgi:hypothetical protein
MSLSGVSVRRQGTRLALLPSSAAVVLVEKSEGRRPRKTGVSLVERDGVSRGTQRGLVFGPFQLSTEIGQQKSKKKTAIHTSFKLKKKQSIIFLKK